MLSNCTKIPILGEVSAGELKQQISVADPASFNHNMIVPSFMLKDYTNPVAYRVCGDSMKSHRINSGDLLVVTKSSKKACQDKNILVVQIGDSLLLKYYDLKSGKLLSGAQKTHNADSVGLSDDKVKLIGKVRKVMALSQTPANNNNKQQLPINQIINGDAAKVLLDFPDNSIDIVVTSPPYDNLRDYEGFSLDLDVLGEQFYRVLKPGGIVGMVIQDQTKNFGKSLTSFRTIINWCDHLGFKLFECLIYRKYGAEGAWWNKRFRVDHEYMPIFIKGDRPAFFNKEELKVPSKHGGKVMKGGGTRLTNGVRIETRPIKINMMKCRGTVWEYMTAGDGSRLKHKHPATFPDKLPYDLINCFCPAKGIVLDPMCGSGTTLLAAKKLGRNYIGIDIAQEYCKLSTKRINTELLNTGTLDLG